MGRVDTGRMTKGVSIPASIWRNPRHFLAFGCGIGAIPHAPGTFGTLLGVIPYLAMQSIDIVVYLVVVGTLFVLGSWLCHTTARDIGVHDHPGIVFDEIVGFLLTMAAAPPGWWWIALGFLYFRIFDIWKPWPIRDADRRVPGGVGIMLDDILAGVYAWLALQASALIAA
jgi:phosphatidylglycerophosphatase A